jgi:hypothetical protein
MNQNSFILCRYNSYYLLETKTRTFLMIEDAYEYLINYFDFIEEFRQSYLDYLNENHVYFQKNYVFSFSDEDNLYELYAIDKNCNNVLLKQN